MITTAATVARLGGEASRLDAELASLMEANRANPVDPHEVNRLRTLRELIGINLDAALAADAAAQAAQRAIDADRLLDTVAPAVNSAAAEVWAKWEQFHTAAAELHDAYRAQTATISNLIGAVTSTVDPSSTDRYSQGPAGVVVDRRTLRNTPELSASVMAAVAPLVSIGNKPIGDRLRTASGTATKLRPPTPTAQPKVA
jgi:hypothetical protein